MKGKQTSGILCIFVLFVLFFLSGKEFHSIIFFVTFERMCVFCFTILRPIFFFEKKKVRRNVLKVRIQTIVGV